MPLTGRPRLWLLWLLWLLSLNSDYNAGLC